jgi:hypothetical protein
MLVVNQFRLFRIAEKSESSMSDYLNTIAFLMLVLSPLFIPIGVTVAPPVLTGVRRTRRRVTVLRRRVRRIA